jgi:hypothetical protein
MLQHSPDPAAPAVSPSRGPHLMSCDVVVGEAVVNRADETLGELAHFMLDMQSGRIAYVVLARGGVLGLGEKLHAIPWSAVSLDTQRECLVVDINLERMERAPGFDRAHWPPMSEAAWQRRIESFYSEATLGRSRR